MPDNTLQSSITKSEDVTFSTIAEQCLQSVSDNASVLKKTLEKYGDVSLAEYLDELKPSSEKPFQSRHDFLEIYRQEVASLLGEAAGIKAAEELNYWPMVLTANHLGVDFFSQSVQTNLLFYLLKKRITPSPVVLPVIACGSVPLDNVTYPLGVLLYKMSNGSYHKVPKKLPVFSNKVRRTLVSIAPPFDRAMVARAQHRLEKMAVNKEIGNLQAEALQQIFTHDYNAQGIMGLESYSSQAIVVNNRIWQRLFAGQCAESHLVTIDMEKIVSQLLQRDLNNEKSLLFYIIMDDDLRQNLIENLDNKRACWNISELQQRLDTGYSNAPGIKMPSSCGTVFFWGVNQRFRRIPLLLLKNSQNSWVLRGVDDKGEVMEVDYSLDSILSALKGGRILPSIFTSFVVLAFARGLTCLGGYYQAEYLPLMQKQLVASLRETGSYSEAARLVEKVETGSYLSGMQTVMTEDKGNLVPAGPVEIIAGGGLTEKDLERMLFLSVRDAHLASLFETVGDISAFSEEKDQLKHDIAQDCWVLRNKVVVK